MLKESHFFYKYTNTKLQIQTAVCVDCKHEGYLTKVNVFSLQCICLISFCICIWRFGIWWKVDKAAKHHPRLSWLSAFQPPPSVYMSLCGVHWNPWYGVCTLVTLVYMVQWCDMHGALMCCVLSLGPEVPFAKWLFWLIRIDWFLLTIVLQCLECILSPRIVIPLTMALML